MLLLFKKKQKQERIKPPLLDSYSLPLPKKRESIIVDLGNLFLCICGGLKICPQYLILLPSNAGAEFPSP